MTAKLMIREVGARDFTSHNGPFEDDPLPENTTVGATTFQTASERAIAEGERLCSLGNVEAFQVWSLVTTRQRVWKLEEVTTP